nr:hypothetical protein [Tanacetum cinerariifolium]
QAEHIKVGIEAGRGKPGLHAQKVLKPDGGTAGDGAHTEQSTDRSLHSRIILRQYGCGGRQQLFD